MSIILDISKFINESSSPFAAAQQHAKTLVGKWENSGLLEGLDHDYTRNGMATLLNNQAVQLLAENSKTGTTADSEQWSGVALPLVRKVFGEVAAKEFVSVQPMNLPSGLVFYLEFRIGSNVPPRTVGESVYGNTSQSAVPTGGFYGAGRFNYSINDLTASIAPSSTTATSSAATSESVNFEISPTGLSTFTVPLSNFDNPDKTAVRSFVPSGSGWTTHLPQYTKLTANEQSVVFVVNTAAGAGNTVATVHYSKQPTATTRGDFEDTVGSSIPPGGVNLDIPQIDMTLHQVPIVARTRKLKAVWTPELAQDLSAYHSIDAEAELTSMLAEFMSVEIDLEILDMLITSARTTGYWSKTIGRRWNGSAFVTDANPNQAWTDMTWYQTLGQEIQRISNRIHQLTMRGGANFIVCSPDVATILESIAGFTADTDGNQSNFAFGVSAIGSLKGRFKVYKNPYMQGNLILLGYRGSQFLETGAAFCPYVPFIMTPLVYDTENFTPRKAIMTRYAKLVVRHEFFAKIYVENLTV